jgi:hypothetical protein
MTVYTGNTSSHTNRIQKIKTSPKPLQIRRGDGRKMLLFSEIKTGEEDANGLSAEELVSGVNWRTVKYGKGYNSDPTAVDDVRLADIAKQAPNKCCRCYEPIPGKDTRYVRITVQIPSVGAEAEKCMLGTFCVECFNSGGKAEQTLDAIDAKADGWKRNLKPRQLEAWTRCKENGEKQETVADDLGISQGEISKLLAASCKVRDSYQANIP